MSVLISVSLFCIFNIIYWNSFLHLFLFCGMGKSGMRIYVMEILYFLFFCAFWFLFIWTVFLVPRRELLRITGAGNFAGRMPFVLLGQQYQSTGDISCFILFLLICHFTCYVSGWLCVMFHILRVFSL